LSRRTLLALSCVLSSCTLGQHFALPDHQPDEVSLLFALSSSQHAPILYAIDLRRGDPILPPFSAVDGDVLDVFFSRATFDTLSLAPGFVMPEPEGAPSSRLLLDFARGVSAVAKERLEWGPIADVPGELVARRVPRVDPNTCLERGCFDRTSTSARPATCYSPCDQPQPDPPMAPNDVAPPSWPCPSGWTMEHVRTATACAPPDRLSSSCSSSTAQWLARRLPVIVGSPCPVGHWSSALPPNAHALYVLSTARPGGSGTSTAPLSTIGAAIARAHDGDLIALAAEDYTISSPLDLPTGVTLFGACTAGTGLALSRNALVRTASLQNLRLSVLGQATVGATLRMKDVVVSGNADLEVAAGGSLATSSVSICGTSCSRILVQGGGSAELDQTVVAGLACGGEALRVSDAGSLLSAADLVLSVAAPSGINVSSGAHLELHRASISNSTQYGIALDAASTATVSDLVIRALAQAGGFDDSGIKITGGSRADISRALLVNTLHYGVLLDGGSLHLADVVALNSAPPSLICPTDLPLDDLETGVYVPHGDAKLERVLIAKPTFKGAWLSGDSVTDATDLWIDHVIGCGAEGITIESQAQLSARGLRIEGIEATASSRSALDINGSAQLALSDVLLDSAREGIAICVVPGGSTAPCTAQVTLDRARIQRMSQAAMDIVSDQGTRQNFTDLLIERSSQVGIEIRGDAQVLLSRCTIRASGAVGVCIFEGNQLHASDVTIADTRSAVASYCRPSFVSIPVQGVGAMGFSGAMLDFRRFVVETSSTGIRGVGADTIDLADGAIRNNRYGVHTVSQDQWFSHVHRVVFTSTSIPQTDLLSDQ
jgi:hypothetical protein